MLLAKQRKGKQLEEIKANTDRDLYYVTVKYSHPMGGTIQIFADSTEHAIEMVTKVHVGVKDFEIIDSYKLSDEQKNDVLGQQLEQMEFDFEKGKPN